MATPKVEDIVSQIAAETNTPVEKVSKMYTDMWAEYSDGARILDYMTVLVSRRVRENLRNGHASKR